ncbi:MAG: hypothetical protein COW88_00215 [Candidatus Lloydbacteria bacterium CG22_combo_CG10-13_8_21_14_all_47_15]|uniref:General secretion pathway GspH domain-containing protein n=1 Tax=Candidatus Lloydbacteria bacterium CG22_combo_CG10-13_8_21_14_all_47_15 TaxID=1974635 RepID=A0A2H0CVV7_9BACT|nr:MAG: hypothetical protein COW88_00215 [Candidatus Lloydbacteria bacterium CG22_combo_CG10-13_8_21_14_all_47_15]
MEILKIKHSGFTLVEFVIAISIFVIFATLLLANYPAFLSRSSIDSLAHEIALTVRQAREYGQNIRLGAFTGGKKESYGVYFSALDQRSFVLFADLDNSKDYDSLPCGDTGTECLENLAITSTARIVDLCGDVKTEGLTVDDPIATCGLSSLYITFTRPNPDAYIQDSEGRVYSDAEIVVSSVRGIDKKVVVVWTTGQILVE